MKPRKISFSPFEVPEDLKKEFFEQKCKSGYLLKAADGNLQMTRYILPLVSPYFRKIIEEKERFLRQGSKAVQKFYFQGLFA